MARVLPLFGCHERAEQPTPSLDEATQSRAWIEAGKRLLRRLGEFQAESRAQDVRDVLSPARTTASLRGNAAAFPAPEVGSS